jgi:glycosyltransferase involved in cell wall biosynthesis
VSVKVLHVITRLTMGGSSESTIAIIEGLGRAGYDCRLAVGLADSEPAVVERARRRGCRIVAIPGLGREVSPVRDLVALAALLRVMIRERPAIVHTHTSKAGFLGRLAARLSRVPAVIHQPHGHIFYGYYGPWLTGVYLAFERLAARWSDRIVTLTDRGAREHRRQGIGHDGQFATVPSGVPTEALRRAAPPRADARAHFAIAPDDFVVVGLGRLVPVKGFDLLVAAMPALLAEVPRTRVMIVGDGPQRGECEARIAELGLGDHVGLVGAAADVPRYLAAADVLAAPSRNEGMGRALVEAMALGVPVVAAAVGGIPDVVVDGECGRLVQPDDSAALAQALAALGRDPALRRKLGDAAARRAERFSTAVAEARMRDLYATLVGSKGLG